MRTSWLHGLLAVILLGCGPDLAQYDGTADRYTGADAQRRIENLRGDEIGLPASATNFYLFDGGNFNGCITYASFDCATVDDCWGAVKLLAGPEPQDFQPWKPSQYAVVMDGPGFYFKALANDPWNVRAITHGVVFEEVLRNNDSMTYFAIDLDQKRVYYHYESGRFPANRYQPQANRGQP